MEQVLSFGSVYLCMFYQVEPIVSIVFCIEDMLPSFYFYLSFHLESFARTLGCASTLPRLKSDKRRCVWCSPVVPASMLSQRYSEVLRCPTLDQLQDTEICV